MREWGLGEREDEELLANEKGSCGDAEKAAEKSDRSKRDEAQGDVKVDWRERSTTLRNSSRDKEDSVADKATAGRPDTDGETRRVVCMSTKQISKGGLGKKVELGYKAQVSDKDHGVVLDYDVALGNTQIRSDSHSSGKNRQ